MGKKFIRSANRGQSEEVMNRKLSHQFQLSDFMIECYKIISHRQKQIPPDGLKNKVLVFKTP